MTGMRWLVLVSVVSSCAKDLCAEVSCRRPPSSTCLSETELETPRASGTCEPSTGQCSYRAPIVTRCAQGDRCSEGACRCVPSLCAGCCAPNGPCVQGAAQSERFCGLGGAVCEACAPGAACVQDAGCTTCPPLHVVQRHACVDDDVEFDVSLEGARRWQPLDGGLTLWHAGPAGEVTLNVLARSALADLNGTGLSALQLPISLAGGAQTVQLELKAPSGRTARQAVTAIATRAIAPRMSFAIVETGSCHVTSEAQLNCDGELSDAGGFVGAGDGCGLREDGQVWCLEGGSWARKFNDVEDIIDLTLPCVLSRDGAATCAEKDGGFTVQVGPWRALECRTGACCGLTTDGAARCWGSHEYNLFDPTLFTQLPTYPQPRDVYGLPGRYVRLNSAHKTFFGQTDAGVWTAASNRMGFPGPVPFVIEDATATTLKLDSPYYCVMGLENDGGAWVRKYFSNLPTTTRVDAGVAPFIDFSPLSDSRFRLLTSTHQLVEYQCP